MFTSTKTVLTGLVVSTEARHELNPADQGLSGASVLRCGMARFEVVALLRNGRTQRTECSSHSQARECFAEGKDKVLYKCILSYDSDKDTHPTLWAETS